jgi:pimeloyl-ACP methyl ester carboxylesterase
MSVVSPRKLRIRLASGLSANVLVKGRGAPLFFLHPAQGRTWSGFLDRLAERNTVYAPLMPGAEDPEDLALFDGFSDLALYYDDLFRALGIDTAIVVGHSFGGMIAAAYAAFFPDRVSALVLLDSLGLSVDGTPIAEFHTTDPSAIAELLFSDPEGEVAKSVLHAPTPESRVVTRLALGAATHFYRPVAGRDLRRRLYRITSPTLLVWGAADRIVPPVYAGAFAEKIARAKKVLVKGAAHFPHLEKTEDVVRAIVGFVRVRDAEVASS